MIGGGLFVVVLAIFNHHILEIYFLLSMRKNKVHKLKTEAEFSNLAALRDFFVRYGKKAGLTKKQLNDGKLAVDEAVTNVMRHAYAGSAKGPIIMQVARRENRFEAVFTDWGKEFDWSSVIDPDLNKYVQVRRKGGLGVWLIKKLTDNVHHERKNGMNILTISYDFATEQKRALFGEFFSGVRSRMNVTMRFAALGMAMVTAILAGVYMMTRSSQEGLATRSFIKRGVNTVRNVAENSGPSLVEEEYLKLNELVANIKKNVLTVSYITVLDGKGRIIADSDSRQVLTRYRRPSGVKALGKESIRMDSYKNRAGLGFMNIAVPVVFSRRKIGEVHLGLDLSLVARAEGLADSNLRTFFFTLLIWVVGLVGVVMLTWVFITPIRKLSRAMALVGAGEHASTDLSSSFSEYGEINKVFNDMIDRLRRSEAQLTDQTRIKKEMQLAKDIQETLLPKEIPETEGYELTGSYRSALEMGGDYYDFFYVDKHSLGLVVGDVSGKGIGAALIMTMVRTAMRTEARGNKRASDVLDKINRLVAHDIKKGMYITMYYVVLDSKKRTINYSSAGHNPMILYRGAEDNIYFLNPKGFAVGLQLGDMNLFSKNIKSQSVVLNKGDLLFIYTDGITEAMNSNREEFGETRLVEFIKHNHHLPLDDFKEAMDKEISRFTGDYPQSDDITYIVIRRKEHPEVEYYGRVCRLIDLVQNSNMLLEKVLEKTRFSKEEYEAIMAKYEKKGLKAFEPKVQEEEVETDTISHATLEQSKKIVAIVRDNPSWGAIRIQKTLQTEEFGNEVLTVNIVNKELRKLKLDTRRRRQHFADREISANTVYKDVDKKSGPLKEEVVEPIDIKNIPPPPDFGGGEKNSG